MKGELVILSNGRLLGTWNAKAGGRAHTAQIKALVPKLLSDAAYDLRWARP
jgi:hypothetical protein